MKAFLIYDLPEEAESHKHATEADAMAANIHSFMETFRAFRKHGDFSASQHKVVDAIWTVAEDYLGEHWRDNA